jgi:hypothetical protein
MAELIHTHDHFLLAGMALFGTLGAAGLMLWLAHCSRHAKLIRSFRGVSPPFVNVVGVLFALTLAFLANDTWNAHDRAVTTTFHEAGNISSIVALSQHLPPPEREAVRHALDTYVRGAVHDEWPMLGRRLNNPATENDLVNLLSVLSRPELAARMTPAGHQLMLQQAIAVRDAREQRIALSQTHVNPLKWLGMAFLGLLTMISIAMVYVDQPKAELLAVALFAAAAAPTAAIVLIQGNPYQPPSAASSAPLAALLR